MTKPLFSIALAAYNYGHYLPETIEGVLKQDCGDFEIVISDDCSSDNTFAVASEYARADPRLRVWRNERNLGSRANINKCFRASVGDYVIPLQADDVFLRPDHLSRLARAIRRHPDVGFLFTAGLFVTNEGRIARRYAPLFSGTYGHGRYFLAPLSRLPPWNSFTAIRRDLLDRLGGEEEQLVVADFELTLRIAHQTQVAYLPGASVVSRVHDQAQGIRLGCAEEEVIIRNNLACLDSFMAKVPEDDFARRVIRGTEAIFSGGHRKLNNKFYTREHLARELNPRLPVWRQARRRVAVYGAGEHTRRMFEWTDLRASDVVCIMDQDPSLHGVNVMGCRVVPPEAALASALDVIIVSSASQQDEIHYALDLLLGARVELFTFYPRQFTGSEEARAHLEVETLSAG